MQHLCRSCGASGYQVLHGYLGKHGDYFVGNGDRANGKRLFLLPAWLPLVMGNAREQPAAKIWNSMAAQEVRKSIHDVSYRYCSKVHCNWISGRSLPSREEVLGKEKVRSEAGEERASLEQLYPLEKSKGPSQV